MKKISSMAARHVMTARLLVAIIHIILFALALQVSNHLRELAITLPASLLICCLAGVAICVILDRKHLHYFRRRLLFFISGLLLFTSTTCYLSNDGFRSMNSYPLASGIHEATKKPMTRKEARKKLKAAVKEIKKAIKQGKGDAGKILLTTLAIIVALGLLLLLAALACEIACNGSEALAILVFVVGLAGIIFLLVWVIRKINRKKSSLAIGPFNLSPA